MLPSLEWLEMNIQGVTPFLFLEDAGMDAKTSTVVYIPVPCAPKKAPWPHCGKVAKRVRTGEYQPRCGCCQSFRTSPEDVMPRAKYDNKVRQAVLDRILDDGMNVEATLRSLQRDFHLNLSTGFVYDCLHDAVAQLQMSAHRQQDRRPL
jgi:hypothetical protein